MSYFTRFHIFELGLVILSPLIINMCYPEPRMDEVFHIRQLDTYLKGNFFV